MVVDAVEGEDGGKAGACDAEGWDRSETEALGMGTSVMGRRASAAA